MFNLEKSNIRNWKSKISYIFPLIQQDMYSYVQIRMHTSFCIYLIKNMYILYIYYDHEFT